MGLGERAVSEGKEVWHAARAGWSVPATGGMSRGVAAMSSIRAGCREVRGEEFFQCWHRGIEDDEDYGTGVVVCVWRCVDGDGGAAASTGAAG